MKHLENRLRTSKVLRMELVGNRRMSFELFAQVWDATTSQALRLRTRLESLVVGGVRR